MYLKFDGKIFSRKPDTFLAAVQIEIKNQTYNY